MTTFAQWRSPSSRLEAARVYVKPQKYDIRVVDQFYCYCQAVSHTDGHCETAAKSLHTIKRSIWAMLVGGSFLFYYLMDRVALAMY